MKRQTLRSLGLRLLVAALFLFALYSNIHLIFRNYRLGVRLRETRADVEEMTLRNKKLELLLAYYQTPSYQEVEARRRLGLKKADETTVILKGLPETTANESGHDVFYEQVELAAPAVKSNIVRWLDYLRGR